MGEMNWREMFSVENVERPELRTESVGDCNENCLMAREIKCVCRCKGKNHGARLREHVKSLDEFEDPVAETFSPEEYLEELRVLA
jgi:hypothetical protein